jgi:glycosyltransferase involved in cell wall biosynthesis
MRVAIISEVFLPKIDGVVNRTLNLVRHLPALGDELLVVCPRAQGCRQCPVRVIDVPSFPFPLYPEYRVGQPDTAMVEAVRRFAPDVIHYVNPFAFGFRCHDALGAAGVRAASVFSFHTLYGEFVKRYKPLRPLSRLLWWLTREYHNRAERNLTVSALMQEDLVRRGFRNVELWPPAVNTELFHPDRACHEMRAKLSGGRAERPLLLTVSRLAPEKNVGFLADVLAAVPEATLAIVGDGPFRQQLERRFEGLDARFVGYLTGEALARAYASADAFVYASETETMGNVVLEAMASGRPVVVPRAGGIPSLVNHQRTGFLYEPRNVEDAVGHLRRLLTDCVLRFEVGQAGRHWVQGRGWESSVARVREVYAAAIRDWTARRHDAPPTWGDRLSRRTMAALVGLFKSLSGQQGRTQQAKRPIIEKHEHENMAVAPAASV